VNARQGDGGKIKMKKRVIVGLATLALIVFVLFTSAGNPGGSAFRTIHQFNLTTIQEESRLRAVLDEFNQLFSKLGFPEVRYRLWRAQESTPGQWTYIYDSIWPDRDTYDKVHQNSAYKTLIEKHLAFLQQVLKNEIYGKYIELKTAEKNT
jgi:hypothetical protein